jgi:hypothetical protein
VSLPLSYILTVAILDTGWHTSTHRVYEPLGESWSEMVNSWWPFIFVGGINYVIFKQSDKHYKVCCICYKNFQLKVLLTTQNKFSRRKQPTKQQTEGTVAECTVAEVIEALRDVVYQLRASSDIIYILSVCLSLFLSSSDCLCSAGYRTQDLKHARQVIYHWLTLPALSFHLLKTLSM